MKKVGFIGWRGMVGSVLMERMREENDFSKMESYFFSTSTGGIEAPVVANGNPKVLSSIDVKELMKSLPKNQQQRLHYLPPGPDRQRERSKTFQGIADAMAEQWGS